MSISIRLFEKIEMSYSSALNGDRIVPIKFKYRCDNPKIQGVTGLVKKRKFIRDESKTIQDATRSSVKDIFSIENGQEMDIEVVFLGKDNKKCGDQESTDSIETIGVIFKNGLLGRVKSLESNVKELKDEVDLLKASLYKSNTVVDLLKTSFTKNNEARFRLCL